MQGGSFKAEQIWVSVMPCCARLHDDQMFHRVGVAFEPSGENEDPVESLPNLGLLEYLTDFAAKLQKKEKQQVMNYLDKLKVERNVENLKIPAVTTFESFLDWK